MTRTTSRSRSAKSGTRSTPPITWRSTRTVREDGQDRTRFGFAVLDLQPGQITVAYVDDDGNIPRTETIT